MLPYLLTLTKQSPIFSHGSTIKQRNEIVFRCVVIGCPHCHTDEDSNRQLHSIMENHIFFHALAQTIPHCLFHQVHYSSFLLEFALALEPNVEEMPYPLVLQSQIQDSLEMQFSLINI